jgi:hypothetical protein
MIQQPYYFEIKDMLSQFVTAFDNIVIKRYNVNREPEDQISVRYLYSPKQRVLYDIVNQAQNMTLPAVAVTISGISRDPNRVFNKLDGFTYSAGSNQKSAILRSPVPINISVSMSIITRFQTDMDQILSNFVPYNNPYVVISWKIPNIFGLPQEQEIRSEVLWDGNISMEYPVDLNGTTKPRVIANTNFTIKGWLFKENDNLTAPNIYYVDNNFYAEDFITSYNEMSALTYTYPVSTGLTPPNTETVIVSGYPWITNMYFDGVLVDMNVTINYGVTANIILQGYNYTLLDGILLSSNNTTLFTNLTSIQIGGKFNETITGQLLQNYTVINDSVLTFNLPSLTPDFRSSYALLVIVPFNQAGFDTTAYTYNS